MTTQRGCRVALALLVSAAAALLLLLPGGASLQHRELLWAGVSASYPAGTDALGRDRLLRMAAALLLGLGGAAAAAAGTTALAALVGVLAASGRAWVRAVLLLVCDAFLTLPWLFLLMVVRGGLPLSASPVLAATVTFTLLALLGWPACARAVAQQAGPLLRGAGMLQGRAVGLGPIALARLYLVPALGPLLWPQFLVSLPAFVMAEADLGALGLGVPEPLASWGGMLQELNGSALQAHPPVVFLPIVLLVAVLLLLRGASESSSDTAPQPRPAWLAFRRKRVDPTIAQEAIDGAQPIH